MVGVCGVLDHITGLPQALFQVYVHEHKALQRVLKTAQDITGTVLHYPL